MAADLVVPGSHAGPVLIAVASIGLVAALLLTSTVVSRMRRRHSPNDGRNDAR